MLHVYFLSCKREKKTKRKGERSLTYMHVLCVGEKKEASKLCIQLYGERKRKRQGERERWKGYIKICS